MYSPKAAVGLLLNVNTDRPLQTQLFDQLRAMILDGQLKPRTPLPATRSLSEQLGISRNTVVHAYDRLLQEGYIESRPSIGTFVSGALPEDGMPVEERPKARQTPPRTPAPEPAARVVQKRFAPLLEKRHANSKAQERATSQTALEDIIDFSPNGYDASLFPERAWRRAYNQQVSRLEALCHQQNRQGFYPLRRAIAEQLGASRGIMTDADHVVIVPGLTQARLLLARLLLAPNEPTGAPSYENSLALLELPGPTGFYQHLQQQGADVSGFVIDRQGFPTQALPDCDVVRRGAGRGLLYLSPRQSRPLGFGLSLPRQIELLDWALSAQMMIIEDEADSDFAAQNGPLPALKGLDKQGQVIYLGGFEPVLGPLLPLSYLVLPSELVEPALLLLDELGTPQNTLAEAALADFIEDGAYDRHLRKLRKCVFEKQGLLKDSLAPLFKALPGEQPGFDDGTDASAPLFSEDGGLCLTLRLPPAIGAAGAFQRRALAEAGVMLYPVFQDADRQIPVANKGEVSRYDRHLIFGIGGLMAHEVKDGAARLAQLLSQILTELPLTEKRQQTQANRPRAKGASNHHASHQLESGSQTNKHKAMIGGLR